MKIKENMKFGWPGFLFFWIACGVFAQIGIQFDEDSEADQKDQQEVQRGIQDLDKAKGKTDNQPPAAQSKKSADLYAAIEKGDIEAVRLILDSGLSIETVNSKGQTLLYVAALDQQEAVAGLLISRRAKIDAPDQNGYQPIHAATFSGSAAILKQLIAFGAKIDAVSYQGLSPLHTAAWMGQNAVIDELLSRGATINAFDNQGFTPLHYAAQEMQGDSVGFLLKKGANPDIPTNEGLTAMNLAVRNGDLEILRVFLDHGVSPNHINAQGKSLLYLAVFERQENIVEFLLSKGANPNIPTSLGLYPLQSLIAQDGFERDPKLCEILRKHGAMRFGRPRAEKPAFIPDEWIRSEENQDRELIPNLIAEAEREFKKYLESGGALSVQDPQGNSLLHWAVENRLPAMAQLLIAGGNDVNAKDRFGFTPLLSAAQYAHAQLMELLLTSGAKVNAASDDGWTAIHYATHRSDLDTIDLLVQHKANLNAQNLYGDTPLALACQNGFSNKAATSLINHGADVNIADFVGRTPLHKACAQGGVQLKVIPELIRRGAKIDAPDFFGSCPLHEALGSNESVEMLLRSKPNLEVRNRFGCTPLYLAAEENRVKTARLLIERGAQIDAPANSGSTPLRVAAERGSPEMVALLLEKGANPDLKDRFGISSRDVAASGGNAKILALLNPGAAPAVSKPSAVKKKEDQIPAHYRSDAAVYHWMERACTDLHKAIILGDLPKAKKLIEEGKDLTAFCKREQDWVSPLHCAVYFEEPQVIQWLVAKGVRPDLCHTSNKETPLHFAAGFGRLETAKCLVENGASLSAKNSSGETPLRLAIIHQKPDIIRLFISKGDDINSTEGDSRGWTPLHQAAYNKGPVEMLIELGADVNARDTRGQTPLFETIELYQDVKSAQLLLDHGAQLDARDKNGDTVLHFASMWGGATMVQFFLEKGLDANIPNASKQTPLHLACNKIGMARALIAHGADVGAQNAQGQTPLHEFARAHQSGPDEDQLLRLYLDAGADINAADPSGRTPLYAAINQMNAERIELLLENGARCDIRDQWGMTPLRWANESSQKEKKQVIQLLKQYGAKE